LRVQLFNPPVHHYQNVLYRMNPPLGLPILSAVLRQAGHECEVVDLEALGVNPQALEQAWAAQRDRWPDVVGFTALSSSARGARESIAAIRRAGYTGGVIVGGPHATLMPMEVFQWGADVVVRGECEGNIVKAVERAASAASPLITNRALANYLLTGQPLPIEAIPAPDWSHHNPAPTAYQGNAPHLGSPEGIAMFSRGCPHQCIFCGNPVYGQSRKRFRPPEAISAEMAELRRRHIKAVFVYDDEMVGTRLPDGWLPEVADRLAPLGLLWKTQ
jgi:anaerobic magnesium-protoporphyrin IX monomethyl ester cyclase